MEEVRPVAISRAYELLQKVAAYRADLVSEDRVGTSIGAGNTRGDDDAPPPAHSPLTQSPGSDDGRRSTGSSTAAPLNVLHRSPTPTLDIVQAAEELVDTAAQTSTPTWGNNAQPLPPPPPPPPKQAVTAARPKPSSPSRAQSPVATAVPIPPPPHRVHDTSLNQSSVVPSHTSTLDTSVASDDPRRVVIHSRTPPRVTTMVRTRTAATAPRGYFSQELIADEGTVDAPESGSAPAAHDDLHHHAYHRSSTTVTTTTVSLPRSEDGDEEAREIEERYQRVVKNIAHRFSRATAASADDDMPYLPEQQQMDGLSASERLARRTAGDIVRLRNDATKHHTHHTHTPPAHRRLHTADMTSSSDDGFRAPSPLHRARGIDLANIDMDWLLRSHKPSTQHAVQSGKRGATSTPTLARRASTPVASVSLVRGAPEPSNHPPTPTPRHTSRALAPCNRRQSPVGNREPVNLSSPSRAYQETFSSLTRRRMSAPSGLVHTPVSVRTPAAAPPRVAQNVVVNTRPVTPTVEKKVTAAPHHQQPARRWAASPGPERNIVAHDAVERVSVYTVRMRKVHQERVDAAAQRVKAAGGNNSTATNTTTSSVQRRRNKPAAELEWAPMPNRHAIGGTTPIVLKRRAEALRHADIQGAATVVDASTATASSSRLGSAGSVSHISAVAHHASSAAVSPLPHKHHRPPTHLSLIEYLHTIVSGGPTSFTSSELASMNVIATDNGRSMTFTTCRAWAALTMLINQTVCLEEIVVPLLIAELQNRIDEFVAFGGRAPAGKKDPSVDIGHLLCALIGIGTAAKAALELLLEMLENGVGDARLVGLAVRVCGGEAAVRKLCTMASDAGREYGPQTQVAAVNALALLPSATAEGHTAILCVGLPQLVGSKMFYQPRSSSGSSLPAAGSDDDGLPDDATTSASTRPVLSPHHMGYRTTFVFLDAELVRRHMSALTTTALYQKRWREQPPVSYAVILRDFFNAAPFVCSRMRCDPNVNQQLTAVEADAAPWLDDEAPEPRPPTLTNSLAYLWQCEPLLGRHITMTLIRILNSRTSMPVLLEATLRTIAVLPPLASEVLAEPLVEYTTRLVDALYNTAELGDAAAAQQQVQLIKEATLATCRVVNPEVHPQKLVDSATAIAVHLLRNDDVSLSRAGCIALGTMGPVSSNPHAVIKLIVEALMESRLPPRTCCWALARGGCHGAACLVDIASQVHLGPSQRVEAAKALGYLTITSGPRGEGSELVTGAVSGLMRLVVDHMTRPSGDALAVAALHSLVELHQRAHKRGEHRMEYATSATLCNMLEDILRNHTIGSARAALLQELFLSLCRLGGTRGLTMVGDVLLGRAAHRGLPTHATVAAAFGLRGAGADGASILASALSHDHSDTRAAAADTLIAMGESPAKLAQSVFEGRGGGHLLSDVQRHLSNALHLHTSGKAATLIETWLARLDAQRSNTVNGDDAAGETSF